ncbi:MAG: HEAT repeat domain-containing protein [Deltaproteobacteria bacterium]|nr:HEAT repeat domain-containing protein [Deltaproteobacteria bacterium]
MTTLPCRILCWIIPVLVLLGGRAAASARTGPLPPPGGGDALVRIREQPPGSRILEVRRGGTWVERWRATPPEDDEDGGTELAWLVPPGATAAGAVRYRWDSSLWVCGRGPLWQEPEIFRPERDRFEPLPRWLQRPEAALSPAAGSPLVPASGAGDAASLAPAASFVGGSPGPQGGRPEWLSDGSPRTGWGRRSVDAGGDLVATAVVEAETPWWILQLEPLPGHPLPAELWLLLLEGSAYRLQLDAAAGGSVACALPDGTRSSCLSLVLPGGVAGALGEVRVLTQVDRQGEQAASAAAAVLAEHSPAARAAARRFTGSGEAGLRVLASQQPPAAAELRWWGEAVARTAAPGASALLLDRLEHAPPPRRKELEEAALLLEDRLWTEVSRRLAARDAGTLGSLLAWLAGWGPGRGGCRRLAPASLLRLLQPDVPLDTLLQAVRTAAALGCSDARPALLALAGHEDEQTRIAALAALPMGPDPPAGDALLSVMEHATADASPDVRRQALLSLARVVQGEGAAAPDGKLRRRALALLRSDPWPEVRSAALLALAAFGECCTAAPDAGAASPGAASSVCPRRSAATPAGALGRIIPDLRHPPPARDEHLPRTLPVSCGPAASLPEVLRVALGDPAPQVRAHALQAGSELQLAAELVEPAMAVARNRSDTLDNRLMAVELLRLAGPAGRSSLQRLAEELLGSPSPTPSATPSPSSEPEPEPVRQRLGRALRRVLGQQVGPEAAPPQRRVDPTDLPSLP